MGARDQKATSRLAGLLFSCSYYQSPSSTSSLLACPITLSCTLFSIMSISSIIIDPMGDTIITLPHLTELSIECDTLTAPSERRDDCAVTACPEPTSIKGTYLAIQWK